MTPGLLFSDTIRNGRDGIPNASIRATGSLQ